MTSEKLEALEKLVQEQLDAGHTVISQSLELSCICFQNKSGAWRMLTDLRAINKVIQPMGSLQTGIPLASLIRKAWPIVGEPVATPT